VVIDFRVLGSILTRGADQNLTSAARLQVECYRVAGDGMRALEVSEFDQLVTQKSGIAVGDDQMSFSLPHVNGFGQVGRSCSGGVDDDFCLEFCGVARMCGGIADSSNRNAKPQFSASQLGQSKQGSRGTGRVEGGIFGNEEAASH